MTNQVRRLVLATAVGLGVLLAASASYAQHSIAPFSVNIKSKIYTFNYPTTSGGTFSCAACYVPGAVFSSSGTTGGASYFYGPVFVNPRTAGNHPSPTTGYYFNPYWGAQSSPGITSSGGGHPATPRTSNVATISPPNPSGGPDFAVAASQPGLTGIAGSGSFGSGGNYLGTFSSFNATNGPWSLGSGNGPGTATFNAPAPQTNQGEVRFTKGSDHAGGFGGTLDFLGANTGFYLLKTPAGGGANCAPSAILCYYYIPFFFPQVAVPGGGSQNQWSDVQNVDKINVYFTTPTSVNPSPNTSTTSALYGVATTLFTTHEATTGTVSMAQPAASAYTLHVVHGSDNRTAQGAGNITLVTGWLGHSILPVSGGQTSNWGGSTVYKFTFPTVPKTPSLASPALGALGGLMAIGAVYVIRKRSSGN